MTWRQPVTRASLLLMESIWTFAIVAFFIGLFSEGGEPSLIGVFMVVGVSFAISRAFQSSDLSLGVVRLWGTLLSFLLFYMIVRVEFFGDWRFWDFGWANDLFFRAEETLRDRPQAVVGIPLLWGFWLRGLMRGQQQLGWDNVLGTFAIGVLIMAFVLAVGGATNMSAAVGRLAIPYVAIGLIAISLAHASRAEDESGKPFTRTWLAAIGGSIVALAIVAAVLSIFDLGTVTEGGRAFVRSFEGPAGTALYYIGLPLAIVFEYFFLGFRWLVYLILGEPNPQPPQAIDEMQQCITSLRGAGLSVEEATRRCTQDAPDPRGLPAWLDTTFRVMGASIVILFIGLVTALMFARFRKRETPSELKESLYQEGRLAADLGGLLNSFLGRFRPNLHLRRDQADAVRRLYHEMVDDASHSGLVRRPGQTPLEFAPRLDAHYRVPTPHKITDAFDEVRYGAHEFREEDVRRLREEWESRPTRSSGGGETVERSNGR